MKIVKSYNNNIVLSKNEKGKEVILIGKGIAFGMHKGQEIDSSRVEKTFELNLQGKERNRYEEIIKEIPVKYITAAEEIISYIRKHCKKHINENIYITLTDHIAMTVERLKEGIQFDNAMITNTRLLYNEEYQLALHAVEMLRERFCIQIDDSEANFITLHIVMAEMDANMEQMHTITGITDEILKVVWKYFQVEEKDNFNFDRFMIHCRFFAQRVINNEHEEKGLSVLLLPKVRRTHDDDQSRCVDEIEERIYRKYKYRVNDDEKMYLLIHLYRLTK